jgi:hypothetical protein
MDLLEKTADDADVSRLLELSPFEYWKSTNGE